MAEFAEARRLPSPAAAWWTVTVLFCAYMVSFVDRVVIGLLVEPIKADLHLTDTDFALLQGMAFALLYSVLGLPFGWLADRYSRRWLVATGSAVWCLSTAACGLAGSFGHLLAARIGVGAGEATLPPSAISLISDSFPPHRRAMAMSVYTAASSIGAGAALLLGGLVIAIVSRSSTYVLPIFGEMAPWRAVFVIVGIGGLVVTLLTLTISEPGRERRAPGSGQSATTLRHYLLVHRRVFLPLMTAMILYAILAYGLLGWVPAFFMRSFGMSAGEVGFQYGLLLLVFGGGGGLAGAAVAARFTRRFGSPGLIVCAGAAALTGPLMAMAFAAPSAGMALAWLAPALLTYTVPSGLAIAAMQSAVPAEHRGMAAALYYLLIGLLGMTLGPLSVALLTDFVFGTEGLRWSLAVVAMTCAPIAGALFWNAARPHASLGDEVAMGEGRIAIGDDQPSLGRQLSR
ncbi:MFS transporter [Sphingosinicella sp. LY1275]|uniref:MFS transporter n=1 Tax=Sphingosinicella sp. LY1275 TaxID=3095379 RepID=UPI002ADEB098|nr:MFS transporter [Sphingosinicella sp. LY1275]MEA1015363.1 MFS transporter [Sphingosinicella sp. LY1275]